jgi:cell division protease FtsH
MERKGKSTFRRRDHHQQRKRRPPPNTQKEDGDGIVIPIGESVFGLFLKNISSSLTSPRRAVRSSAQTSSESGTFHLENVKGAYNFTRVGGYHEVKNEMSQVLDFIFHPGNYTPYGVRIPRGVLLEGPTGNGKTLLAKCLAGEAGMNFVSCSGAEFNEKYVGVGASRIRELFKFAEDNKPCIIFIDEIDALGRARTNDGEGSGAERDQTLNQLLVNMDGFSSTGELLVMGATNRIDILDKALIRPGRIDKIIHVPNPDAETRGEILKIHRHQKPLNVSDEYLVKLTNGFNGAQIENLLNEAVLFSIRNRSLPVSVAVLDVMKEKLLVGQTSGSKRNISAKTLERIAVHEIGHLVMAVHSLYYEKPWKVTIDSMNPQNSLGYTIFEADVEDEGMFVREYFEDKLKVLLGGRVAEEVFYGNSISSGALSDLESAFSMAKKMVMEYGMGTDIIYPYFSETYKKRIDEQIHFLILKAYKATQVYMEKNKGFIEAMAHQLVEKRTMDAEEIRVFYDTYESLSSNNGGMGANIF